MLDTVAGRVTDGSAFRLVARMWDSLGTVHAQLEERRKKRGGGGGPGEAGFGGTQPPVPPPPAFPPAEGV